jgi:L-serine deaminase
VSRLGGSDASLLFSLQASIMQQPDRKQCGVTGVSAGLAAISLWQDVKGHHSAGVTDSWPIVVYGLPKRDR